MTNSRLWIGGLIHTGSGYAEALLEEDGRIVGVGEEQGLRHDCAQGTEVVDLHGRTIVPGLIDAHLHLGEIVRHRGMADLAGSRSILEVGERLTAWSAEHPDGPIVGQGWDEEEFRRAERPRAADLDRLRLDRPIVLFRRCGHVAWLDSKALLGAGVDRCTPEPAGGRIGRAPSDDPDGLLFDAAVALVEPLVRAGTRSDEQGFGEAIGDLAALGITAIGTMNVDRAEMDVLTGMAESGALEMTVCAYARERYLPEIERGRFPAPSDGGPLDLAGIKLFADGAFGPRTAALNEPYADEPTGRGILGSSAPRLAESIDRAHRRSLSVALHAVGDRAIAEALGAFDGRARASPPDRIEHAALTPPPLLEALARRPLALVVQPQFVLSDRWLDRRLGPERRRQAYAFASLLHAGARLAGSSDAPFDLLDPWSGLRSAVERIGADRRSANPAPAERLTPEEALALYTTGGATALGKEELGRLAPGRPADFVILRARGLVDAIGASSCPVEETWRRGRCLFRAPDARSRRPSSGPETH